jgi:hypothetical protein
MVCLPEPSTKRCLRYDDSSAPILSRNTTSPLSVTLKVSFLPWAWF